jgi:F-type H+-transporting ATPase subunit delta
MSGASVVIDHRYNEMKISKQSQRDARHLFRSCQVNGLLDENKVRQAVSLVLAQKPRGYVGILSRLHRLVKLDVARRSATVESALPLAADLRADVSAQLAKIYGASVNVAFSEDPALLGGLRIQVGSDLYDGSVKTRLEKLEQSF